LGVSGVWTVTTSLSASRVGVSTKVSPTSCNAPPHRQTRFGLA
jgi:hypothetical protein